MVVCERVHLSPWNGRKEFYSPAPSHGEDFLPLDLAIIGGRLLSVRMNYPEELEPEIQVVRAHAHSLIGGVLDRPRNTITAV